MGSKWESDSEVKVEVEVESGSEMDMESKWGLVGLTYHEMVAKKEAVRAKWEPLLDDLMTTLTYDILQLPKPEDSKHKTVDEIKADILLAMKVKLTNYMNQFVDQKKKKYSYTQKTYSNRAYYWFEVEYKEDGCDFCPTKKWIHIGFSQNFDTPDFTYNQAPTRIFMSLDEQSEVYPKHMPNNQHAYELGGKSYHYRPDAKTYCKFKGHFRKYLVPERYDYCADFLTQTRRILAKATLC